VGFSQRIYSVLLVRCGVFARLKENETGISPLRGIENVHSASLWSEDNFFSGTEEWSGCGLIRKEGGRRENG
jgi:hypothetical protein